MEGLRYKPDPEREETAEALAPRSQHVPRVSNLKKMIGADYGEVNGDSDDR